MSYAVTQFYPDEKKIQKIKKIMPRFLPEKCLLNQSYFGNNEGIKNKVMNYLKASCCLASD